MNTESVLRRVATHVNDLLSLPEFPETFDPMVFGNDVAAAALESMSRSGNLNRGGLRLSKIGTEPILLALEHIGINPKDPNNDDSPLFVRFAGHLWEAFVRSMIRTSSELTVVDEGNKVTWNGVDGHFDILVETRKGRRVLIEVKHLSESYLRSICNPERTYSEASGTDILTGKFLPELRYNPYDHDTRGYLTQAAAYAASIPRCIGSVLVLWNKQGNYPLCVPVPGHVADVVLRRASEVLAALPFVETLHDVFTHFEVPPLVPQISKKMPTGRYYVPLSLRYCRPDVLDLLYVRDGLCPDLPYVEARTEPPNLLEIEPTLWEGPTMSESTVAVQGDTLTTVPTQR